MGSFQRSHAFDPLDLEIIDLVYEVAWEQVSARQPSSDTTQDEERRPRYASVSSPSLATAGWISTLFSTECLRAYRSRLGRRRLTETTFSQQLTKRPSCVGRRPERSLRHFIPRDHVTLSGKGRWCGARSIPSGPCD